MKNTIELKGKPTNEWLSIAKESATYAVIVFICCIFIQAVIS